eukprot:gene2549-biopygen17030
MRRRRRRPGHGIDKTDGNAAPQALPGTNRIRMRIRCPSPTQPAALAARESPVAEGMLPLGHRPPGTESEEAIKLRHVAQLRARALRLRVGGACAREDGGDAGVRDSAPPPAVHQRRDAGPALPLRGDCAVLKQRCLARALDLAPQVIVVERFDKFRLCAIAVVWERAES